MFIYLFSWKEINELPRCCWLKFQIQTKKWKIRKELFNCPMKAPTNALQFCERTSVTRMKNLQENVKAHAHVKFHRFFAFFSIPLLWAKK